MQKTIKQWLSDLPEPYRSKALAIRGEINTENGDVYNSLYDALFSAFHWKGTSEGHEYWAEVAQGKSPVILTTLAPTCAIEALMTITLKKGFDVQDITGIWEAHGGWEYTLKENSKIFFINLKTDTDANSH